MSEVGHCLQHDVHILLSNAIQCKQAESLTTSLRWKEYQAQHKRQRRESKKKTVPQLAPRIPFLSTTSESVKRECLKHYISSTSPQRLQKLCCAVCARWLFRDNYDTDLFTPLESIANQHLLVPLDHHPAMELHNGLLLQPEGLHQHDTMASISLACSASLRRNSRPRLSLASGTWVGDTPPELLSLTIPEQLLIALAFPRTYIVKLYPKNRGTNVDGRQPKLPPDQLYDAWCGNVCSLDMPHPELDDMLRGGKLPHPPSVLADLVSTLTSAALLVYREPAYTAPSTG